MAGKITLTLSRSLLEAARLAMDPSTRPVSCLELLGPRGPSLHDLFDIEPEPGSTLPAPVELAVPSTLYASAAAYFGMEPSSAVDITPPCSPSPRDPEIVDLTCDEILQPAEEEPCEPAPAPNPGGDDGILPVFQLDCPPVPGHNCASCNYHRDRLGDPNVTCALCYFRLSHHMIFGKCCMSVGT